MKKYKLSLIMKGSDTARGINLMFPGDENLTHTLQKMRSVSLFHLSDNTILYLDWSDIGFATLEECEEEQEEDIPMPPNA